MAATISIRLAMFTERLHGSCCTLYTGLEGGSGMKGLEAEGGVQVAVEYRRNSVVPESEPFFLK